MDPVPVPVPPPVLPEVLTVPGPLKLIVMLREVVFRLPLPVRVKDPVAPLKVPVPPVIVAEPEAEVAPLVMAEAGSVMLPVSEPVVPENVIVKGAVMFAPVIAVREILVANVPLETPLASAGAKDAVPVSAMLVPENGPLAFTVIVVLMAAAWARAPANRANAQTLIDVVIPYFSRLGSRRKLTWRRPNCNKRFTTRVGERQGHR